MEQRKPAEAAARDSVLAIGAHPGDLEIGAAGALLAHKAAGIEVTTLTLAPAVPVGAGISPQAAEAARAIGTRLAVDDLVSPEAYGSDHTGAAVERAMEQIQPTVLYIHSINDDNPDHRNAHLAAAAAARRIGRIYCFQSPSATIDFRPTHFVPIDEQMRRQAGRRSGAFTGRPKCGRSWNPTRSPRPRCTGRGTARRSTPRRSRWSGTAEPAPPSVSRPGPRPLQDEPVPAAVRHLPAGQPGQRGAQPPCCLRLTTTRSYPRISCCQPGLRADRKVA